MDTSAPHLQSPSPNPRSLTTLAFRWPSRELFAAAEAVEEMLASSGWQALMRLLDEFGESERAAMYRLVATNQAAASQSAGRLEGLEGAARAAQAIRAAAEAMRSQLEAANEAAEGARG